MSPFHRILVNNLLANITNFTAWFAITFWVFLETGSVFATGMIAGIFLTFTGVLGIWLGALVDHHGKTEVMAGSSLASFAFYALSFALMQAAPAGAFANPYGAWLWILVVLVMGGVIAGNIRSIALPIRSSSCFSTSKHRTMQHLINFTPTLNWAEPFLLKQMFVKIS
jgi:DHA3 family multidrug efflux protein-like MFS transporter